MPFSWRLIDAPILDGAGTMGVDNRTLETAMASTAPDTVVRVYRWGNPTLSVGVNQPLPEEVEQRCSDHGIEVVRRITGGGAVLHTDDVTYSVVGPSMDSVLATYARVAEGLVFGLSLIGLNAEVCSHDRPARALACFSQPTGADLEVGGRKICGSAQVRRGGYFLQHGSIPVSDVRAETAWLLGTDGEDSSTFLAEAAPGVGAEELTRALISGFKGAWGPPSRVDLVDLEAELSH